MGGTVAKDFDCKYNHLLECPPEQRQCWRCGWNPDVSCERRKKLAEKLNKKEE